MAITHSSVTRDASPTPSDNSDHYYSDEPVFYDEEEYAQSLHSASDCDITPTPAPTRRTSPASVVELAPEDFQAPTASAQVKKAHRESAGKKGKDRAGTCSNVHKSVAYSHCSHPQAHHRRRTGCRHRRQ
jgi:hypothetical protein